MTSLSASLVCKILTVFLLICLAKASGGTCLSYGHSCWGGHGKRNVPNPIGGNSHKRTGAWYISKLFNPSLEKTKKVDDSYDVQNQEDSELEKAQKYGYQIFPVLDGMDFFNPREETKIADVDPKSNRWGAEARNFGEDVFFIPPEVQQRVPLTKFRLFRIMDQGNGRRKLEK